MQQNVRLARAPRSDLSAISAKFADPSGSTYTVVVSLDMVVHEVLRFNVSAPTKELSENVTTTGTRRCWSYRLIQLGKQFLHDARPFDSGQPRIQTLELHAEPRMIDP